MPESHLWEGRKLSRKETIESIDALLVDARARKDKVAIVALRKLRLLTLFDRNE
jgi:hypothetical protein